MQISKFALTILIASAGLTTSDAQNTSAQQDKALEILRQKLAEERQKPPVSTPAKSPVAAPVVKKEPAPVKAIQPEVAKEKAAPAPSVAEPIDSPAQRRGLEVLRKAMEQDKGAPAKPVKPSSPIAAEPKKVSKPVKAEPEIAAEAKEPQPKAKAKVTAAPVKKTEVKEPTPAPPVVEVPAGPKTKQQLLADLLEEYKADKITPPQYQELRAKILAAP